MSTAKRPIVRGVAPPPPRAGFSEVEQQALALVDGLLPLTMGRRGVALPTVPADRYGEALAVISALSVVERPDRGEAALKQWYRRQALELLSARTAQIAEAAGISYAAVTVTDARHRWGSCGADGRIHFAWRLIMAEPAAIDYVIVHELCHRLELNHSDAFWCHVAALLPDWRPRETWLKDHGALLRLL